MRGRGHPLLGSERRLVPHLHLKGRHWTLWAHPWPGPKWEGHALRRGTTLVCEGHLHRHRHRRAYLPRASLRHGHALRWHPHAGGWHSHAGRGHARSRSVVPLYQFRLGLLRPSRPRALLLGCRRWLGPLFRNIGVAERALQPVSA